MDNLVDQLDTAIQSATLSPLLAPFGNRIHFVEVRNSDWDRHNLCRSPGIPFFDPSATYWLQGLQYNPFGTNSLSTNTDTVHPTAQGQQEYLKLLSQAMQPYLSQ